MSRDFNLKRLPWIDELFIADFLEGSYNVILGNNPEQWVNDGKMVNLISSRESNGEGGHFRYELGGYDPKRI